MSTKEHAIEAPSPALVQLTPDEAETLRVGFRAELANVISARADSSGPQITNVTRRQKSKKSASKKGTKKGASKKATKKGARKTSKKK